MVHKKDPQMSLKYMKNELDQLEGKCRKAQGNLGRGKQTSKT